MEWIEFLGGILDNRKIKIIRKGPGGDTLVFLWLVMLAEAGRCDRGGCLMVTDALPYNAQTLSLVADIPVATVRIGLARFTVLEMIDMMDNRIVIREWGKYRGADRPEKPLPIGGESR